MTSAPQPSRNAADRPPSLVPGVVLLVVAAVLMVVVLVKPPFPGWLNTVIAVLAVLVVLALLVYAGLVFHRMTRRGGA